MPAPPRPGDRAGGIDPHGVIVFCPNLATCDNTDDMLAIDPRPGGVTSHCAADNIALLDLAVSRLPGPLRRRAQEDPRITGHRARRTAAPPLPQAGNRRG